jgi:5,10-methenyltetrahydromethanopterin hydrogenase
VLENLRDRSPSLHIAIEHQTNKIDALLTHYVGHAQVVIHDLVYAIEGILLVDDGVKQDAKSPDVLLFAAVRLAGKNFGGCVIWC